MSRYKKKKTFKGLNKFARYQTGMTVKDLYPQPDKTLCACGCGQTLPKRRRRWFSDECNQRALQDFFVIKGDTKTIRYLVNKRDKGICHTCGLKKPWQAHHILPVFKGGGACGLDNFETLCENCHLSRHKHRSLGTA